MRPYLDGIRSVGAKATRSRIDHLRYTLSKESKLVLHLKDFFSRRLRLYHHDSYLSDKIGSVNQYAAHWLVPVK